MADAEAVIALYKKYGILFTEQLDGDFACAVSDGGQLILARDWAGIKPLYYGHCDGRLCFASEAKALVGIAEDVREFPPGYVYSREQGFKKYRDKAIETPEFENYNQSKTIVKELLMEATEKRIKDGAVGGVQLSQDSGLSS